MYVRRKGKKDDYITIMKRTGRETTTQTTISELNLTQSRKFLCKTNIFALERLLLRFHKKKERERERRGTRDTIVDGRTDKPIIITRVGKKEGRLIDLSGSTLRLPFFSLSLSCPSLASISRNITRKAEWQSRPTNSFLPLSTLGEGWSIVIPCETRSPTGTMREISPRVMQRYHTLVISLLKLRPLSLFLSFLNNNRHTRIILRGARLLIIGHRAPDKCLIRGIMWWN